MGKAGYPKSRIFAWTIFWLCVLVLSCEYLLVQGYPWRISWLEPYILLKSNDDWAHNAFKVEEIRSAVVRSDDFLNSFVFLGGSAALEAVSKDTDIENMLRERDLEDPRFVSITSSYKTFADEAKIAARIADAGALNGLKLIIPIEVWRFKVAPEIQLEYSDIEGRFVPKYYFLPVPEELDGLFAASLIRMSWLERKSYLARVVPRFGDIVKKRAWLFAIHKRIVQYTHDRHFVSRTASPASDSKNREFNEMLLENDGYQDHYRYNFELLAAVVEIWRAAGGEVILLELPVNPENKDAIEHFGQGYTQTLQTFIQNMGVTYIDFSDQPDWRNEHFRDLHHMLASGQEIFSEKMAQSLYTFSQAQISD